MLKFDVSELLAIIFRPAEVRFPPAKVEFPPEELIWLSRLSHSYPRSDRISDTAVSPYLK